MTTALINDHIVDIAILTFSYIFFLVVIIIIIVIVGCLIYYEHFFIISIVIYRGAQKGG